MIFHNRQPVIRIYFSILLFYTNLVSIFGDCNAENRLFVIRSVPSGLVVSASELPYITIHVYTGGEEQLWKFERGSEPNYYHIINNATGVVLDIANCVGDHCDVFGNPRNDALKQQEWIINSNTKIVNAAVVQNLDITDGNYTSGARLGLWHDGQLPQQEFFLQEKLFLDEIINRLSTD